MKTITILGAAGRFGETCAQAFLDAGWTVRGVTRGAKTQTLLKGIVPVEADALDQTALVEACEGSDVILHALNPSSYDKWEELTLPMGENVLAAARASGATVMMPGNVYNFGTSIPVGVNEQTAFSADTSKAKIRIDLEALFENATDVQMIIIRAGDFFGGKRLETWLDLMILKDLHRNKFRWPGPYDLPHAFAYLPDLGIVFARVAEKRRELDQFEVFHFEGNTLTGNQMHKIAEEVSQRKLKRGHVPWWLLRAVGVFNPLLKAVCEMSYLWRTAHSLDGAKLAVLIEMPSTDINIALRQTIIDQKLDAKT